MSLAFAIDRAPETVQKLGAPQITAFTLRSAAKGYVKADPDHRHMLTKPVADALCRLYLGMSLKDAIDGGKI
jgi:hypothetical protein